MQYVELCPSTQQNQQAEYTPSASTLYVCMYVALCALRLAYGVKCTCKRRSKGGNFIRAGIYRIPHGTPYREFLLHYSYPCICGRSYAKLTGGGVFVFHLTGTNISSGQKLFLGLPVLLLLSRYGVSFRFFFFPPGLSTLLLAPPWPMAG